MKAMRDLLGVDEFSEYLASLGLQARPATDEETAGLSRGGWGLDRVCIAVDDGPFDLVWVRLGGAVGPRQNLKAGAFSLRIGPVPVMSNRVLPLQAHYLLWAAPGDAAPDLRARLRMRTRGWWNPEVRDVRWTGGRLASLLDRDGELTALLRESIDAEESLRVVPDARTSSVRIVHGFTRTVNFSLLSQQLLDFHQRLAPPELIEAIGRIAEHVRELAGA